ncbi:MAG: TonB-dependent receptor, partial [Tepidisphaeraceae bacterium]
NMPGGTPIPGNFTLVPGLPVNPLLDSLVAWKYEEIAAFANATVNFNDRFALTGGVRHARNDQSVVSDIVGSLVTLLNAPTGVLPVEFDESVTTWMLSPQWHITSDAMLYVRVATGYRPGGYSYSLTPIVPLTSESDEVTSYELGFKGNLLDGRLLAEAAVFHIDWENMQLDNVLPPPAPAFVSIDNAGDSQSRGVEGSLTYAMSVGLRLRGTVAYIDAELTDNVPTTGNAPTVGGMAGDRMPLSPRWSGSVAVDYVTALSDSLTLDVGAGYRYADEVFTAVEGNANLTIVERGNPTDLYVGLEFERVSARLYARNVFDEEAEYTFVRNQSPAALAIPVQLPSLQPRTIGLNVDVSF